MKTSDIYDNFSHEDYLKAWDGWESTIEAGEYGYFSHGRHVKCFISKLSLPEFQEHVRQLKEANLAFETAHKANDLAGMDQALGASFPHELVLLI